MPISLCRFANLGAFFAIFDIYTEAGSNREKGVMAMKSVIISDKFKTRLEKMNILHQETNVGKKLRESGYVKRIEEGLYVLFDQNGLNGVGILDAATFWQAVLSTEVAGLWDYSKKGNLN